MCTPVERRDARKTKGFCNQVQKRGFAAPVSAVENCDFRELHVRELLERKNSVRIRVRMIVSEIEAIYFILIFTFVIFFLRKIRKFEFC